ncbi:MAG: hypothetical protein ACI9C4_002271 [Paraglaciecola sp.]
MVKINVLKFKETLPIKIMNTVEILKHSIATAFINRVKDLKMIKFTKKAGVVVAIAAVLGTSAHAAVFNATASFRTIADVGISDFSSLNFGQEVFGKAGSNCIVTPAYASAVVVTGLLDSTSSGCTDSGTAMTAGGFTISGATDAQITIFIASVTEADFSFVPSGNFNDNASSTVETDFFPDTNLDVSFDGGTDGTLVVGGELTIINDLTNSTSYTLNYDVSVIY